MADVLGCGRYLLPHLLHLAGGVAPLVTLLYPQAEDGLPSSARARHALHAPLLALRLPQLGLGADRLRVVHVICLHHLGNGSASSTQPSEPNNRAAVALCFNSSMIFFSVWTLNKLFTFTLSWKIPQ